MDQALSLTTTQKPTIKSIDPVAEPLSVVSTLDLFLFAVGYETRSTWLAKHAGLGPKKLVGIAFQGPSIHAFDENVRWCSHANLSPIKWKGADYRKQLMGRIFAAADEARVSRAGPIRLGIDISSMTREMMAEMWAIVLDLPWPVKCTFFYSCAKFGGVPENFPPITINEPISALFTAWPIEPQLPIELIIGLGYEKGRAAAAIEFFEAQDVTFFSPVGGPDEYLGQVQGVNRTILGGRTSYPSVKYDLMNVFDATARLSQLVARTVSSARSVIVPFGPKTFALAAMLTAISFPKRVSVWRLSGGINDPTPDREPTGAVSAVDVLLCEKMLQPA